MYKYTCNYKRKCNIYLDTQLTQRNRCLPHSSELGTDNGQAIYRTFLKSGGTHGIQNVS